MLVLYARMESPAGGVDLEEFAAEFGIDPRTLRRDLQALRSAGAAIDSDRNSEGRWYYLTKKIPT